MAVPEENAQQPVLTLKNLYRLLTRRDYPSSSWPVFPPAGLKGETLVRFWRGFFGSAFPEGMDLSVFETGDRPGRNLTRLLNRSGSGRLMSDWFRECSALLDQDLFWRLTGVWMEQLERHQYIPASLDARLERCAADIEACRDLGDPELSAFFRGLIRALNRIRASASAPPLLFSHAVVLSWLALYALYGTRPADPALTRLRIRLDQPFPVLYAQYRRSLDTAQPEVLSARRSVLCVQPLSEQAYFGGRELLEDAAARLIRGEKLAVTGIGGAGKTEFVRQLLERLNRADYFRRLAFVQYRENLASSFRDAFPAFREAEDPTAQVRALLEEEQPERTLLLIDNVDTIPARDPALNRLSELRCGVVLTSRLAEPDGFSVIPLSGLDPESARKLFLYRRGGGADTPADVDRLCAAVACHPLAVSLFASLCKARFWPAARLTDRLRLSGLSRLTYVRQASPVNLADVFAETFSLSALPDPLVRLMRLLAMLPYRYRLPEMLLPYTPDLCGDADTLAEMCGTLRDLGWLLVGPAGEEGFAMHPMIAETVRLEPCRADDFPLLWASLAQGGTSPVPSPAEAEDRISLLLHTGEWNADALRCLSGLEQEEGVLSGSPLPEALYDLHRQALDDRPHTASEEADYWLGQGIRDIVVLSRRDRLPAILHTLRGLEGGLGAVHNRAALLTLLEFSCRNADLTETDAAFSELRPEEAESAGMADYLISLSVRRRVGSHDLAGALAALEAADALLGRLDMRRSLRQSNLDYRRAVCLLDLGRATEARPLLERCLGILLEQGYAPDAQKLLSTRSTYAVSLTFTGDMPAALREYEILADTYRRVHRDRTLEYAMMRNNASLVLDSLGRLEDARSAIEEALALDGELNASGTVRATHLRNAALILAHSGDIPAAEQYAGEAAALRTALFGADSPWTADAEAVQALTLAKAGRRAAALAQIEKACSVLEQAWGPDHRHTRNAEAIRQEICRG